MNFVKKVFEFPDEPEWPGSSTRKKITLAIFLTVFVGSTIAIELFLHPQQDIELRQNVAELSSKLQNYTSRFQSATDSHTLGTLKEELKPWVIIYLKKSPLLSKREKEEIEGWLEEFAIYAKENNKIKLEGAIDKLKKMTKESYVFLKYRSYIKAWYSVGIVYFLTVFLLYRFGLPVARGEPVFNVLDTGFISVLVQYTGGIYSLAQIVYVLSIFSSAVDYQESKAELSDVLKRVLRQCPYFLAFGINYFWATANDVFGNAHTWSVYIFPLFLVFFVFTLSRLIVSLSGYAAPRSA